MRKYSNPWIPSEAESILKLHTGSLLDVGGGAAPYAKATHIVDIQSFSTERLKLNAWPSTEQPNSWNLTDYTQMDIVTEQRWPFEINQFDLGLCSHCLEDLRDPLPAVREMSRVCKKVLIICPSRLLEQTTGIEHPRYCGFYHHPWIVFSIDNRLVFRRKTPLLNLPQAHLKCPIGKTLKVNYGSMYLMSDNIIPEEQVFWTEEEEIQDYMKFVEQYRNKTDLFINDGRNNDFHYWIYKLRQKFFGSL